MPLRSTTTISPAAARRLAAESRTSRPIGRVIRVYGPCVIAAYMLGTGRWGSYLIPGPPYIGDLALLVVLGERLRSATQHRVSMGSIELTLGMTTGLLLLWACLRLSFGSISTNAFRDFTPYAYGVIVLLTPTSGFSPEERRTMERLLYGALVFHASWVSFALLAPSVTAGFPPLSGGQSHLFELRPDFDSTVCAIAVFGFLRQLTAGRRPLLSAGLLIWNVAIVLGDSSRAAFAALAVQLVLFVVLTPAARDLLRRFGLRILLVVVLIAVPAGVIGAGHSGAVHRLSLVGGSFLPIVSTNGSAGTGASGTALARRRAWQAIERYLEESRERDVAGVGFGPDFLHDSGGDQLLLGGSSEDVRQPHNFLINTWARLGLVGLGLLALIMLAFLRLAAFIGRSPEFDDLDVLAIVTVAGLFAAGCYGVVLESPFGALPFFWGLGAIGTRAFSLGLSPALRRA